MFLTMRSNAIEPILIPNPSIFVVALAAKSFARIFRIETLPQSRVSGSVETREPFRPHGLNDLSGRKAFLVSFLQKYPVSFDGFIGAGFDEFDGGICFARSVCRFRDEKNPVGVFQIAELIPRKPTPEAATVNRAPAPLHPFLEPP